MHWYISSVIFKSAIVSTSTCVREFSPSTVAVKMCSFSSQLGTSTVTLLFELIKLFYNNPSNVWCHKQKDCSSKQSQSEFLPLLSPDNPALALHVWTLPKTNTKEYQVTTTQHQGRCSHTNDPPGVTSKSSMELVCSIKTAVLMVQWWIGGVLA